MGSSTKHSRFEETMTKIKRKARLNAIKAIQEPILKEANTINFFKGLFSDFADSVKSQVNPNHPILSAGNFISLGIITSYSPILGIIFSILGSSFGINFSSIFLLIKNSLLQQTKTPEGKESLEKDPDSIIKKIVNSSVDAHVQVDDKTIDETFKRFDQESFLLEAIKQQNSLIKEAAIGGAFVRRILPRISTVFGKGKGGIKSLLFWVIKAILLGAGVVGTTGAVTSKIFSKDSEDSEESKTNKVKKPITSLNSPIFKELNLSSNPQITIKRSNNAPNDQEMGSEGGYEWKVSGPLAETLYNWIFQTYINTNEVFKRNNITPLNLKKAAEQTANEFMLKTKQSKGTLEYRIPKEYNNVKDVVDSIIFKAAKY